MPGSGPSVASATGEALREAGRAAPPLVAIVGSVLRLRRRPPRQVEVWGPDPARAGSSLGGWPVLLGHRTAAGWRFDCPVIEGHDVTLTHAERIKHEGPHSSLMLNCHGYPQEKGARDGEGRLPGCELARVLGALGCRAIDLHPQPLAAGECSKCGAPAYRVKGVGMLCLPHLIDAVGMPRDTIFGR